MNYYLLFICILDYRNDVRQKGNSRDFLEFKMGRKAVETTHNINNTFGPETADECTVQWWFKKFCKGDKSLEDKELSGQLSEVDNGQLRASLKLILVQLHEKLCKNSTLTILSSFGLRSKLKK